MNILRKCINIKLLIVFIFLSTPAFAEWIRINSSPPIHDYVNPETIERNGNLITLEQLTDFDRPLFYYSGGLPVLSSHGIYEYNCKQNKYRMLKLDYYSKNKGYGEKIGGVNLSFSFWDNIPNKDHLFFKFACKGIR